MNRANSPPHEVLTSVLLDIVGLDLNDNYIHDDEAFTDYCIQIRRIIMGKQYSADNLWLCTGNCDHFYYKPYTVFAKADSDGCYMHSVYVDGSMRLAGSRCLEQLRLIVSD